MVMGLLLEADSIYYSVGGRDILRGTYITCKQGELVALLGRNGCGKSTMLEVVFGTRKVNNAFIRIGRKTIKSKAYRTGLVRMLPQFDYIPKTLSVKKILKMEGIAPEAVHDELISNILAHKISELSAGTLRYFQTFTLLNSAAPFIILDEPFADLSPIAVDRVLNLLKEAKGKKGIIVSDHNFEAIERIADHLIYMEDGQTKEVKNMEELNGIYYRM